MQTLNKRKGGGYGASIPKEVQFVIDQLKKAGFEAYIVGGCVRDFLRNVEPKDWDVATNAKPAKVGQIFLRSFADNRFGTVTVLTDSKDPKLKEIEITTYRIDEKYTDKRHPDKIRYAKTIEEDLSRRDFTVNAMAMEVLEPSEAKLLEVAPPKMKMLEVAPPTVPEVKITDPFNGQKDLEEKIIRTVGNPNDRFSEDALRMMRAARFATTLGKSWKIEPETTRAIKKNTPWLRAISKERIRDELMKIIIADRAAEGIELLRKLGLLKYIIPELEEGYRITQNKHHIYECYEHAILSLKYAAKRNFNKFVRLAALLHDIAKPRVKRGEGPDATFYGHEVVGTKMTVQILNRLKFPKKEIEKIAKLVRYHLFYYHPDEVGPASVRRLVRQVGPENMEELLQVRYCDRIGSGCPKAEPYKLRHLRYVIEKVSRDPISVKMLKVDGNDVMRILDISPGPKVGHILDILLSYVLEDPKKNKKDFLQNEIKKLGKLPEKDLENLAQKAKKGREKIEIKRDEMTKKKYWVS